MCRPTRDDDRSSRANGLEENNEAEVNVPRVSRFAVVTTGLVLTFLTYVWSLAIVETLVRRVFLSQTSSTHAGPVLAVAVGFALVIAMVVRRRVRPAARIHQSLLALNVIVVIGATTAALCRPSHWKVSSAVPEIFTTWGPSATFERAPDGEEPLMFEERIANGELVPYLDSIVTATVASIVIVAVLALATLFRGFARRAHQRASSPDFGSALALVSSVVILISFASALRLFVDNGAAYLSSRDLLPGGVPGVSAPFRARQILPPLNELYASRDDWVADLLPLVGVVGAVALLLGLLACNLFPGGAGRPRLKLLRDSKEEAAKWKRGLVVCLPATFGRSLVVAGILWVTILVPVGAWILYGPEWVWSLAVVLVQGVSVVVVLVIVAGRRLSIEKAVSMAADVVGFWPIASHPFAGASYRNAVVEGLRSELNAHGGAATVLVGHSQGSVLCAWLLHQSPDEFDRVALVTCGSPLKSLYAEFFPAFFPSGFFSALRARRPDRWMNFWRETDPIATPIPELPEERNVVIPDPLPDQSLKVHSDYWIAAEQITAIETLLGQPAASSSAR